MLAEITGITLVILFLLWTCREGTLADEMSIGTLLESVVIENAVIWISPAVWKSQVRAKVRATVTPVALLRRFRGVPAMS